MATLQEIEAEIARRKRQQAIESEIQKRQAAPAQPVSQWTGAGGSIPPEQASAMGGGIIEPIATIGTAALAEPISGIAGLGTMVTGGTPEEAARTVEETKEALTYLPRSEEGKQALQTVAETVAPLGEALEYIPKKLGDFAFELTGSPEIATAAYTAPAAILEYLGLRKLQAIRKGTRLIDKSGRPTKALRQALDKEGLDFDGLTPDARAKIPDVAGPELLPGANLPAKAAEKALVEQIKSGGRDDALAALKVVNGKVGVDKIGKEAIRQGFTPGFVQSVKTANKATKDKMNRMVNMMRAIKRSERAGLDFRPSDVVGDAVTDRIKYIRDTANKARDKLNNIAKSNLKGKDINIESVTNTLQKSLDDLDITLVGDNGIPKAVYKGSLISKDRTSQRVINDLISLLGEGGKPDALRAHKLKRQLDIMIDFNKKSAQGLTDAGKNVLKDIRRSLNDVVRDVDPSYAKVNDKLSMSLNAMGEFDDSLGSIDSFGMGANKAIGTRMRALLSNQQGRIKIENALNNLDDTVSNLGGKFDDSIKDLVMFSDGLDDRFGTVAKTSFAGQTTQGTKQAIREGLSGLVMEGAAETLTKGAEKLRGINDFNAFEAILSILKETK